MDQGEARALGGRREALAAIASAMSDRRVERAIERGMGRHLEHEPPAFVQPAGERGERGDIVVDMLEHIEHPEPAVAMLRKRLAPGGWFIATVPAFDTLWTTHDDVNHHYRRYRLPEIEALVRDSGLEIVEARYFFVWVALVKWLVARKERMIRTAARPPEVPPAPLNAALLALTRLEQRIVGDAHPRFGSSAIVVARAQGVPT